MNKEIATLYKQGEALTEELQTVQEQIKTLKGNTTIKYEDFCALKKHEYEIKVAFCELNIKLAEVANKYEEYCEFFEDEIK